ncbi:cation:proton antiporter [Salinilacihabitans rarus]|uniref:cation:proton antiporter domain-containing protein n=1 Tax=Salinilacihabitans rarus TaxID=2961596 RepID=UPI0020C8998C|nr:cation:proton antiporter [Salinilacihabitans rarus]
MQDLNVALVTIGGLTLVLSLIAGLLHDKSYLLSEPLAALLLGVVVGPAGLDRLGVAGLGDPHVVAEQFARLTVGVAVVGLALRLPRGYFREHATGMAVVLGPGMAGMWLVSGLLAYALLDLSFWVAMLLGAVVTPTDPVLAGTIVTGATAERNIAAETRHVLSAEAGANDGLAYPFVFLSILALEHPPATALRDWLTETLLWEVGAAVVLGLAVGAAAGRLERWSREHEYLEETSMLTVTVALTFAVLGGVKLLGSDGILAAFVAGLAFNRLADARDEADEQRVQETLTRLFTFPVLVVFGVVLPWDGWASLGWTGVALAVGVLLLRRVPMVIAFRWFVEPLENALDALFAGWFGPIGIAALFYAMVALREVGHEVVWTAASLVIAGSIVVHGLTSTPFTKLYGRVAERAGPRQGAAAAPTEK